MSAGWNASQLEVGSLSVIDSKVTNTEQFIVTGRTENSKPAAAGGLLLENIVIENVPVADASAEDETLLEGGSKTIAAWGQGHRYTPDGPGGAESFQGEIPASNRPAGLLDGDRYYTPSKPQYKELTADDFMSARDAGATGDGVTDDVSPVHSRISSVHVHLANSN